MELLNDKNTLERQLIFRAASSRTPVNGSIELLPLCNMNCDFCYVRLDKREMEQQGRMRTADEWLEIGRQMAESGTLFLLLTGGEPLLYPEFKKVYLGLKQMGMIITLNTNGTLIDEKWVAFFAENKPRKINITLYGANDRAYESLCHYPGGFRKVTDGARMLREAGIDVRIGASIGRKNAGDVEKILQIAKDLDCVYNVDTYMMPATRERTKPYDPQSRLDPEEAARISFETLKEQNDPKAFRSYAREVVKNLDTSDPSQPGDRHMSCLAGSCSFTLSWEGYMRPCVILTRPQHNVFEEGFQKSWEALSAEVDQLLISEKCARCPRRMLCRTCAAAGLYESGSYDAVPEYLCRYTEETERLYRKTAEEEKDET